ncbi:TRAP transporter small permease [Halomonas alimentaria]|uniref:TRAP transporter small permease n=1 Tax=Halomonas alimentaria TaxID=147248 RepID=UPI002492560F|nr:TRAP transporter small permease [Halomonas alimentaria]
MRKLKKLADWISKAGITLAAVILIYSVCHTLLEIILRSVFDSSTYVLDEFIGFAVMSITFLSLSWTLRSGAMIRVTLLTDALPDKVFRFLEGLVAIVGFAMVSGISIFLFKSMMKDWIRGAVSASIAEVPLWIPGLIAFIGAVMLAMQLLLRALSTLIGPFEREHGTEEAL